MSIKDGVTAREFFKKHYGKLTFSDVVESTRLGEEMSQVAFAKKLKISRSHLNDIEKGRKVVSPGRAARFAKILGYSEVVWVGLALQAMLDKEKLRFKVSVEAA